MQPPLPSPTATWHNEPYAAINPSNPDLSQTGKTVIITGAGSGIGRATALAFAKAGASRLILTGRTESRLEETKSLLKDVDCSIFPTSVTDEAGMREIASQVGAWDVLILNAGHISPPSSVVQASLQDWWADYETNVKSVIIASQAFIPTAKSGAAFYTVTSGAMAMPPAYTPGLSGYLTSKMAQTKVLEFLAAENSDIFFCAVHPGMIDTGIFRGSGADPAQLPMDKSRFELLQCHENSLINEITVELPASFLVWLSQSKTKFLNGKLVFANWDVEELEKRAEEIQGSSTMTIGVGGWPFSPASVNQAS
jgi:NAD(P)-dependent dehydrogenase (short-subunit alcohol dehydrogenase family)